MQFVLKRDENDKMAGGRSVRQEEEEVHSLFTFLIFPGDEGRFPIVLHSFTVRAN